MLTLVHPDYADELHSPHLLTRNELAEQLRKYVATFQLNAITSAKTISTRFDESTDRWITVLSTPSGKSTIVSKHIVQATGIGSQKPNIPVIQNREVFQGISIHSSQYKNPSQLLEKGVKVSRRTKSSLEVGYHER